LKLGICILTNHGEYMIKLKQASFSYSNQRPISEFFITVKFK